MLRKWNKIAQTTAEYAIVIALVVGAVVAMQVYIKRGLQGRIKDVVDHTGAGGTVGGQALTFSGDQYEPYYLSSAARSQTDRTVKDDVTTGGGVTRTIQGQEVNAASRTQVIGFAGEEVATPDLPEAKEQ